MSIYFNNKLIKLFKKFLKKIMDFGGMAMSSTGGPMISGQWVNQKTGEVVTVRDSYMDGEQMYVTLSNGKQITMEDFQCYVQMSEDNDKLIESIQKQQNEKKNTPKYDPSLVFDGIDTTPKTAPSVSPLQKQILSQEATSLGITYEENVTATNSADPAVVKTVVDKSAVETSSEQEKMIMKILDKSDAPTIEFSVVWEGCPKKELSMLKEYFGVSSEDIAKAIIKKYVTMEDVKNVVTGWVSTEGI